MNETAFSFCKEWVLYANSLEVGGTSLTKNIEVVL